MIKETMMRVEKLQLQAEMVNSTHLALFSAIYEGSYDVKAYEWAFVLFGEATKGPKMSWNA